MMKLKYLFILFSVGFLSACVDSGRDGEFQDLNKWVYDNLYSYYFWYDKIDNHVIPDDEYPEDYFYSLLYDEEDKWSYITDDYAGLNGELQGEPVSMGYSPAFGLVSGTDNVFMLIEYVYPNSPAYKAGLRRGSLITKINNQQLNTTNYIDLYRSTSQILTLAEIDDGTIYSTNESLSMDAELIQVNPVLFDTVYQNNGLKTGYCVITEFISTETFIEKVGESLAGLKAQGINELIVDLRYNGGGYIGAAQWLASAIGPSSAVNSSSVLTSVVYNDKVEAYLPEEDRTYNFVENDINLDLNRIYFLTTGGSASASELTIIGLMPYMDIVVIGENTYGKYTGSWVIPDLNDPPQHNWAMMPIVLKYANADGLTNFVDGLTPDYYIDDNLFAAVPFGDISDPLVNQALSLSLGLAIKPLKKSLNINSKVEFFYSRQQLIRKNLIVN